MRDNIQPEYNLAISIQIKGIWHKLPCNNVNKNFTLTESYFNSNNFKINHPKASISLNLNLKYLDLIENVESFPCIVEINSKLIFGGYADNVYTTNEIYSAIPNEINFLILNFTIRSWTSYFDYELKEAFIPFRSQEIVQPLYICNPFQKDKSILHLLFEYTEAPFLIDPNLIITEKTFSFVIPEDENILDCLDTLFYNLGRYYYIDANGMFISHKIKTNPDTDSIEILGHIAELSEKRNFKAFSEIEVEWADVAYFSRESLEFEQKKSIYREIGTMDMNTSPPKMEPLIYMLGQTYYPTDSEETPVFIEPKVDFLQTNYTLDYIQYGIFGEESGKENKDISIIALWRYKIDFQAEEEIILNYLDEKAGEFAFSFFNTVERPEDPKYLSETLRNLEYLDVFSDVLWRQHRHVITAKNAITNFNSQRNLLIEVIEKPFQVKGKFFLDYINDYETAGSFFNLHKSLNDFGFRIFNFSSVEELNLNNFYKIPSVTGRLYTILITSKTFDIGTVVFKYEAISAFEIEYYDQNTETEQGGSILPPPSPLYSVSNEFDNKNTIVKTDYINDETALVGLDQQAFIFSGVVNYIYSIFYSGSHIFQAQSLFTEGTTIRKRPLSKIEFLQALSEPKIEDRTGIKIQLTLNRNNFKILNGSNSTRFKIF